MKRIIAVLSNWLQRSRLIFVATLLSLATLVQPIQAVDIPFYSSNGVYKYNPTDEGGSVSSSCTVNGGSGDLSNVPDPWRSLIETTAQKYPQADMRLVAATLWIENRGWPAFDKQWATSSAAAQGPWQFIPGTWASMGTDGDRDGIKDPDNPKDAVHAAFKHQLGSAGKPIIAGSTGNLEADLSLTFERKDTNLLYYMAKYNGSGAPDGTTLMNFPRGQNADYVIYSYYLLMSDFTKTWGGNAVTEAVDIANNGIDGGDGFAGCTTDEIGNVNSEGFSFPLGLQKNQMDYLPCGKATCHHDGSPASDMFAPVGTSVFAIEDGKIDSVKNGYDGIAGCYSIAFTGKSGWKYWLGHIKSPTVSARQSVTAGKQLALVGETRCAKGAPPHLHIDRGGPTKGTPGGHDDKRSPTLIPLLDKLFTELPG